MSQLNLIAIELDLILCGFSYEPQEFRWYLHPWKGKAYAGRITRDERGRVNPVPFQETYMAWSPLRVDVDASTASVREQDHKADYRRDGEEQHPKPTEEPEHT
jgi:hypothetical protein